ncbi:hypothetical protein AXA44_30920 [Rhodococcus sp. SC4]|nr:hypothetical protein AXA44_30920 [Rhodococcus sp. SC4]
MIWTLRALIPTVLIVGWQVGADRGLIDPFFYSSPSEVGKFFWGMVTSGELAQAAWATIQATILGFTLGASLAIVIGLVLAHFSFADHVLSPMFVALNALPRVALAPMFVLWFGIGLTSKVVLAASLVFFIVLVNTQAGAKSADEELHRMARAMGASSRQRFIFVVLPSAVPAIFAGLRLGLVYALLGVIVGEMLAAKAGMGQLVSLYSGTYRTAGVLAALLALGILGVLLNALTVAVERRLLRWQRD